MAPSVWIWLSALLLVGECAADSSVYKLHSDSSCKSTPNIIGFQESSDSVCTAITSCTSVNIDGESLYWDRTCETADYNAVASYVFGSELYLLMEIYESGDGCKTLLSGAAFLADGSCLVTDNGLSSMKVKLYDDGSATLTIYRGLTCSGTAAKITTIAATTFASHSCTNDALVFYLSNATTTITTTTTATTTTTTTTTNSTATKSDKTISTTTSESASSSFSDSMLLTATISATLGVVITLLL